MTENPGREYRITRLWLIRIDILDRPHRSKVKLGPSILQMPKDDLYLVFCVTVEQTFGGHPDGQSDSYQHVIFILSFWIAMNISYVTLEVTCILVSNVLLKTNVQ